MSYTRTSAAQVWNCTIGIRERIAIAAHLGFGNDRLWKNAFEQFSQSEQEKLLGVDWEVSTGKRFPQLKIEKEKQNGTKQAG